MPLLLDQDELEDVGSPTGSDLFWTVFVFPLVASLAGICAYRLLRAALGHDLVLSAIFEKTLGSSGGGLSFAAGIALYLVILMIALAGLWWCVIQVQRWLYWRK